MDKEQKDRITEKFKEAGSEGNRLYTLLTTGQLVVLDKDLANSSEVTVVGQTPKRLYTTVTSNGICEWDKHSIGIDDSQGSYKDLSFQFCEDCGNVSNVDFS